MGGDGTLNEVSQGYLDVDGQPLAGPDLALIPSGTGGDFRKTFALGATLEEAVERLATAEARPLDLGLLDITAHSGETIRRAFLNITSFGLGGLTDRLVNAGPKWIGGRAAFFVGSLRALISYANAPVRLRVDGEIVLEAPIVNVAIANGQYFGGGMKIAPRCFAERWLVRRDRDARSDARSRRRARAAPLPRDAHGSARSALRTRLVDRSRESGAARRSADRHGR